MDAPTRRVIIVGGGSAGWITAARVAARWYRTGAIRVILIESPSIETVGVGEGTWPTMRNTLRKAGITDCVDFQSTLCEAGLAPKAITTAEYAGVANYAYHLDAAKLAAFLRTHAVGKLGVEHILDDVVNVNRADNGDVKSVTLVSGRTIAGDLFIDCTGFAALRE